MRRAVVPTAGVALFWVLKLTAGALAPGCSIRQDYVSSLAGLAGLTIAAFRVGRPFDAAGCSFTPGNRIGDASSSVLGYAVAAYEAALVVALLAVAVSCRSADKVFALVSAVAAPVSVVFLLSTGGDANGLWQRAWLVVNTAWLVALVLRAGPGRGPSSRVRPPA